MARLTNVIKNNTVVIFYDQAAKGTKEIPNYSEKSTENTE